MPYMTKLRLTKFRLNSYGFANQILNLMTVAIFSFCFLNLVVQDVNAIRKKTESPKSVIVVKDYKWASGGMGRAAILGEITLENRGEEDYENIAIEVDLYSGNGISIGSLRSMISDVLRSGSEKTFYNIEFGMMHSELQNTVARVVGAELIEDEDSTQVKDIILVKDWEWIGGQYGTEGILKELTLVNKSNENWKDVKIRVDFSGASNVKVGSKGFAGRAVIHDVIPAKGEVTFKDVNVGFRHPGASRDMVSVVSAKLISEKELRYRIAQKEGKSVKRLESDANLDKSLQQDYESQGSKRLSLSERYKKRLEQEREGASVGLEDSVALKEPAIGSEQKPLQDKEQLPDKQTTLAQDQYEVEEVPLPRHDIIVEDFVWGGGVAQTIGKISEITLSNKSGIDYAKIEFKVKFFSFRGGSPTSSNRAIIYDVLPAHSRRTFRDIEAGFLNAAPEEVRIEVIDAVPFAR